MQVLIVDNERVPTAWLKRALVAEGHQVQVRWDVESALPQLEGPSPPHLLIAKVEMPDLPGDRLAHELRNTDTASHIGILLLTITTPEGDFAELKEQTGADGILKAPCKKQQVMDWISSNPQVFERKAGEAAPMPSMPPKSPEERSAPPPPPPPTMPGAELVKEPVGETPRILLVDDEPLALMILEGALEEEDYEVDKATDWPSFRALLLEQEYSVILLDVNMPGLSGDKLAMFAADFLTPPLPRIFLHSGMEESQLAALADQVGADGYLCKGCGEQPIRDAVARGVLEYQAARSASRPPPPPEL